MSFKCILFDLDGTLVNSLEDLADSMNKVLRKRGFPQHSVDEYRFMIGSGITHLVSESLPPGERGEKLIAECYGMMLEDYRGNCTNKTRPYDGIQSLLNELASRGVRMAVLSNKAEELTEKVVTTLFPDNHFDIVMGSTSGRPRKPDPTCALEISRRLATEPADFIYVGDTDVDMKTANSAGMYAVGALWGFRTKAELLSSGARYLLERPSDLIEIL